MNIADKYIQYVKTKTEAEPEKSWDKIFFLIKILQKAIRSWKI